MTNKPRFSQEMGVPARVARRVLKDMSRAQRRMLKSVKQSGDPYAHVFGSGYSRAPRTLRALELRGLVAWSPEARVWRLTPGGVSALKEGKL